MKTTIIRTAQPLRFATIVAASGIALAPFVLDVPAMAGGDGGAENVRIVYASDGRPMRYACMPAR
jgi:hypothetical protein